MIERERRFLLSILYLLDLSIVVLAWLASYPIRFKSGLFPLVVDHVPAFSNFGVMGLLVLVNWAAHLRLSALYNESTIPSLLRETMLALRVHAFAFVSFVVIVFFVGSYRPSRVMFTLFFILSSTGIVAAHYGFRRALIARRKKGIGLKKVLVVGAGDLGRQLAIRIARHRELGLIHVGFLTDEQNQVGESLDGIPILGTIDDVHKVIEEYQINQVFVALPLHAAGRLEKVINNVTDEMVDVKVVPDLVQYVTLRSGVEEFEGLPIISLKDTPLSGWNAVLKRAFDIAFSLGAMPVLLPVMGVVAALVKLTSPGPVFYKQERMGLDGQTFCIYKFRSMKIDAENKTGAVWAVENDPRKTRFGSFLRSSSIDELPQFFNVLTGHMSIVGPRPERPVFIEKFKEDIPKYMLRHKVKAGITGWAQVNGWRGNTDLGKRIECDLYYIANWSFALDIRIIWKTVFGGLTGKNAY